MTTQNQSLKAVLSQKPSNVWQQETIKRIAHKPAYDRAFEIALLVMDIMESKGWNQTRLAKEMQISRQAVSKILQGNRPINLVTIEKLEAALGTRLLEITRPVLPSRTLASASTSTEIIQVFISHTLDGEIIGSVKLAFQATSVTILEGFSTVDVTNAGNMQYAMAA